MKYKINSKKYTIQNAPKKATDKESDKDDYVAQSIGAFGPWQLLYVVIIASTRIVTSWNTMSVVFLAPETDFVCERFTVNTSFEVKNSTCYNECVEYKYVTDVFEVTLISEFSLICDHTWFRSLIQSAMMFGILCGVSLFGWLSDRFGRSKAMILSGVTCATFMFVTPFCPYYWTIVAARFLSGLGTGGYFALTAVYVSEIVGTRLIDTMICICILPFDGAGLPILAGFAYLTSSWRPFMLITSSVTVLIVSLTFFLPETPRWLIAKGKGVEAIDLMTKAAKFNNLDTSNINENVTKITEELNLREKKDIHLTYLDLFRTRKLAVWTIASVSIWFVAGFSYFGLLQYISQFGSNLYIVVSVLGVSQVVGAPISLAVVKFCGRRASSIGIFTIIGVISLALIFTRQGSISAVVLGSLGVAAASVSFSVVYVLVIELYPTPMRNMGLSASSIGSKIAAVLAPFVVNMEKRWVASLIFAVAGFLSVLICLLLPETKGKKLKDTVEDLYE